MIYDNAYERQGRNPQTLNLTQGFEEQNLVNINARDFHDVMFPLTVVEAHFVNMDISVESEQRDL